MARTLDASVTQARAEAVCLQINVAPVDLPCARHTLPHQLRQWGGQVDRILLTLDTLPGGGRFGQEWSERRQGLEELLDSLCSRYPHARVQHVDYSAHAVSE